MHAHEAIARPLLIPVFLLLAVVGLLSLGAVAAQAAVPTFSPTKHYAVGTNPTGVVIGDFNEDGRPDLATSNYTTDSISILIGLSTGGYAPSATWPAGDGPKAIAVGDFNRDGHRDLAVPSRWSGDVTVLLGSGRGDFVSARYVAGLWPEAIAVGDFNADGNPDLVTANEKGKDASVLLGDRSGSFGPAAHYKAGVLARGVAVGDLNEDGAQDVAVANEGPPFVVSLLFGNGRGGFARAVQLPAGTTPKSVAIADLNRDGHLDLAVVNEGLSTAPSTVSVFAGDGTGGFPLRSDFAVGLLPKQVIVGDVDGDGNLDLVVADYGAGWDATNNVAILSGNGTGAFGPAAFFMAHNGPKGVALGDLNLDGRLDLAVADHDSRRASVLLQTAPALLTR